MHASVRGADVEIPPLLYWFTNDCKAIGHCQVGSLTGAVASERVTEAYQGSLRLVGNQPESIKAQGSLTARLTGRAGWKPGLSDPAVLNGRAVAQRIKGTPGITG